MSDTVLLLIGGGIVLLSAVAIFWPRKEEPNETHVSYPHGPVPKRPEALKNVRGPASGFVGPSGKRYPADRDVDLGEADFVDAANTVLLTQQIFHLGDTPSPVLPASEPDTHKHTLTPEDSAKVWTHHEPVSNSGETKGVSEQVVQHQVSSHHHEGSVTHSHSSDSSGHSSSGSHHVSGDSTPSSSFESSSSGSTSCGVD
jgi:hypothetical protein